VFFVPRPVYIRWGPGSLLIVDFLESEITFAKKCLPCLLRHQYPPPLLSQRTHTETTHDVSPEPCVWVKKYFSISGLKSSDVTEVRNPRIKIIRRESRSFMHVLRASEWSSDFNHEIEKCRI
jgi:hypothetical protein